MTKKIAVILIAVILVLGMAGSLFAESYKSKKFPSASVIKKASKGLFAKNELTFAKVAGKYKAIDGSYVVYLYVKTKDGQQKFLTQPLVLHQLDTNLWTVTMAKSQAALLEK